LIGQVIMSNPVIEVDLLYTRQPSSYDASSFVFGSDWIPIDHCIIFYAWIYRTTKE
jgi:hypothetical protein